MKMLSSFVAAAFSVMACASPAASERSKVDPTAPSPAAPFAGVTPGVVDAQTARTLVAAGVKVIDVRTPSEFEAGHVPGALNIPHGEIAQRHAEIGPASTPTLLYCRTGHRSGIAIAALREKGFTQIYDLKSYGLWAASEGAPIAR